MMTDTRTPPAERFWPKVDCEGPISPRLGTPCWLWTAYKNRGGYGHLWAGRHVPAHRFSYELAVSQTMFAPWMPLPKDIQVDHKCHAPECVNPQHLRATTNNQNMEHRRGAQRNSTSGARGITWDKQKNRWRAQITHHGKRIHVGYFDDLAEAEAAVIARRLELFTHNDADRAGARLDYGRAPSRRLAVPA